MSSSRVAVQQGIKLVVVGDAAVGKTNLINVICQKPYSEATPPTVGVDFFIKEFVLPDASVALVQLWDTAGQERFRGMPSIFYRHSQAVMVCFDLTDRATFLHCETWVNEIRQYLPEATPIILAGTKADRADEERAVSHAEAERFASEYKLSCGYVETTALRGDNVFMAFQTLVESAAKQPNASRVRVNSKVLSKAKLRQRRSSKRGSMVWSRPGMAGTPSSRSSSSGSHGSRASVQLEKSGEPKKRSKQQSRRCCS